MTGQDLSFTVSLILGEFDGKKQLIYILQLTYGLSQFFIGAGAGV